MNGDEMPKYMGSDRQKYQGILLKTLISIGLLGPAFLLRSASPVQAQQSLSSQFQPHVTPSPTQAAQTMSLDRQPTGREPQLTPDNLLSNQASDYLHHHRLPFVEARVSRDSEGPLSVILTGQVRTRFGKEDAERKVAQFLNTPVSINNQLAVNPDLALAITKQPSTEDPEVSIVRQPNAGSGVKPQAPLVGPGGRISPTMAAILNDPVATYHYQLWEQYELQQRCRPGEGE